MHAPGLQVVARTINMQFEGNWTPVSDIIVDKVGKYAYIIGSPQDTAITPIVMDVTLDVRTKVRGSALLLWYKQSCCLFLSAQVRVPIMKRTTSCYPCIPADLSLVVKGRIS